MGKKLATAHAITSIDRSYCMGRNGLAPIVEIVAAETGDDRVNIDGISRQYKVINGGLCIDVTAMDKLAADWITAREEI